MIHITRCNQLESAETARFFDVIFAEELSRLGLKGFVAYPTQALAHDSQRRFEKTHGKTVAHASVCFGTLQGLIGAQYPRIALVQPSKMDQSEGDPVQIALKSLQSFTGGRLVILGEPDPVEAPPGPKAPEPLMNLLELERISALVKERSQVAHELSKTGKRLGVTFEGRYQEAEILNIVRPAVQEHLLGKLRRLKTDLQLLGLNVGDLPTPPGADE